MSKSTRRGFLALSATGAAAAAVVPSAMAAPSKAVTSAQGTDSPTGRVVAYVSDAASGEVTVMRGEREVVFHDPALVRHLSKHL